MNLQFLSKAFRNELFSKIVLIYALYKCTFFLFSLLQHPIVYNSTLKKITHTYVRDAVIRENVWKVDQPYYYRDLHNSSRWDAAHYLGIRDNYYEGNDFKYAFFPLFPLIWKISHLDILRVRLLNFLLFGISILILSGVFLNKQTTTLLERYIVLTLSVVVPPIVMYYLPYAEATFAVTFALAVYGLIKNKYWLFFISMVLFAMSRPVFMIVGLSFVAVDIFYFIKHRNVIHFLKELSLKLLPLLLGTFIVFYMYYLSSGSFFMYFDSLKGWNMTFSIPKALSDWSIEGFGMNVFARFFLVLPSISILVNDFIRMMRSHKTPEPPSVFKGDINFIREYFFHNSIAYFWGVFLFVIFFQGGSLNGLHRYVITSPFFCIFIYHAYEYTKQVQLNKFLVVFILLFIASVFLLTGVPHFEPELNFYDSGFFCLLLTLIYFFTFRFMNNFLKIGLLLLLISYNILWITFLYNIFLCDGPIYT